MPTTYVVSIMNERESRLVELRQARTRLRMQLVVVLTVMSVAIAFLAVYFFAFQSASASWWVWFSLIAYGLFIIYYILRYRRMVHGINYDIRLLSNNIPQFTTDDRRELTPEEERSVMPPSYASALTHPNRPNGMLVPDATMLPPPPTYDEAAHDPDMLVPSAILLSQGIVSPARDARPTDEIAEPPSGTAPAWLLRSGAEEGRLGEPRPDPSQAQYTLDELLQGLAMAPSDDERLELLLLFRPRLPPLTSVQVRLVLRAFEEEDAQVRAALELFGLVSDRNAFDDTVVTTVFSLQRQAALRHALAAK